MEHGCLPVTSVAWDLGQQLAHPRAVAGGGQAPGWVGPGFSSPLCAFLWGSNPPRTSVLSAEGVSQAPVGSSVSSRAELAWL